MKDIIIKDLRIQVLDRNLIRIEKNFKGEFCDFNTFFIPNKEKYKGYKYKLNKYKDYYEIVIDEYKLIVPLNNYKKIHILNKNSEVIYKFKVIPNSGELPKSYETPSVFSLNDATHIFVPKEGYSINSKEDYKVEENEFDMYLMIVNKDHNLLRKMYIELVGRSDLVRFKTLGLWHSRYYKYNEDEVKKMIDKWNEYNLPIDNFVIDTDWRKANDIGIGYEIDTNLFPNMKSVFDYAHKKNVTVMFNDHPEPLNKVHSVFDKEEIEFRESNLRKLLELGLDTWWYDRNWITKLISPSKRVEPETLGMYLFNDITKNHYKNREGIYYTRPDIMANVNNVSNGNYLAINDSASHRYGIQWTGDNACDRSSITKEVINLINGCLNEVSYIHFDIGGHVGNPDKELYLDWIKFATFTPIFRLHCCNFVTRYREPWNYDLETVDIFREYLNIRYRLLGYLYSLNFKNYLDGTPVFKSLSYDYKDSKRLRKINNEYIMGNNILVCPRGGEIPKIVNSKSYVEKVKAIYFNNENLEGTPILEKEYKDINFVWNHVSPEKNVPIYHFSILFNTKIKFEEDVNLFIRCDDGVRVYIDGELKVDDWNYHGALENFIMEVKKDKVYDVKIEYFQGGGEALVQLIYSKKDNKKKVILPNDKWIDVFDGKVYSKYNEPRINDNLKEISLFVREGSLIPLLRSKNNTSELSYDNLIYECYPSKKIKDEGFIYEDDRNSTAYKDGFYRTTKYNSYYDENDKSYNINVYSSKGEYIDGIINRKVMFKVHLLEGFKQIKEVLINNKKVKYKILKKKEGLYPFNEGEYSSISDVLVFERTLNIKKNYKIKVILK